MKVIPYGKPGISEEDIQSVVEVLRTDMLTQGPYIEAFEKAFASYIGARYAVVVANGTAALHLSALALNVSAGQKVLTTPNTFVASSNCILYCGGDVEFVDIDSQYHCLDLELLEKKLQASPRGTYSGVVNVDFAGHPSTRQALKALADKYSLWIIEDSCHALGSEFQNSDGQWVKSGCGTYADLSVFSLHPVKHLTTGEGGVICTNDEKLYKRLINLRTHGITKDPAEFLKPHQGPWYYEMQSLGFNYRISDFQCALGLSQLRRIDENLSRRRAIAARYHQELNSLPLQLPVEAAGTKNAFHLYVIRSDRRDLLFEYLKKNFISPQVHYIPVYQQPYYERRYGIQTLPECEKYYSSALSIPMYHTLSEDEQGYVIDTLKKFF